MQFVVRKQNYELQLERRDLERKQIINTEREGETIMEHEAKKKSASFKLLRAQSRSPVRYLVTRSPASALDAGKPMIKNANSINFMYGSLSKRG